MTREAAIDWAVRRAVLERVGHINRDYLIALNVKSYTGLPETFIKEVHFWFEPLKEYIQ